jgi:transcriptional regulator with XRE-family HTH domain
MTVRVVAEEMGRAESTISRIELGEVPTRPVDARSLCQLYGVDDETTAALMALAKETKSSGWWHAYGDVIPTWLNIYIGLEEAATELRIYHSELVPGLLQTADYTTALIRSNLADVDPEEIEKRVAVRQSRQRLITRESAPPQLHIVLNEAVLRRAVGGRHVMAAQCLRLAELSELPHIQLRILPFSSGTHAAMPFGPFVILGFPKTGTGREIEPSTVYIEGMTGALYLDQAHEVAHYESAFAEIMADVDDERGMKTRELLRTISQEMKR